MMTVVAYYFDLTVLYHQTVTTKQIEDYLSQEVGIDLSSFFNQYLRIPRIPTLEY
jgi:aminopeptidase N